MEGVHVDVLDEEVDDGAVAATTTEVGAGAGNSDAEDPNELRAGIGKAQA